MIKELEEFVLKLIDEIDSLETELMYECSTDFTDSKEKLAMKIEAYKNRLEELK